MSIEIKEIASFLKATTAFRTLSDERCAKLSHNVTIRYLRAGETILEAGGHNEHLFLVRSGAVELRLAGDELSARLGPGLAFAYPSLLRGGEVHNTTKALEDTLLYAIPAPCFHELRAENQGFKEFFAKDESERLGFALRQRQDGSRFQLDSQEVGNLIAGAGPITCPPHSSITQAVELMHKRDVSTLAICEDERLLGIFTDKDLRNRVVAKSLPLDQPIASVMTNGPKTLSVHASAAEAMAMMAGGGFRHIPLVDQTGSVSGILSATDILSAIGNNAIDTGMQIAKARNAEELVEAARCIPHSFCAMVEAGMHAGQAMRFTSALGEATHRRAAQITHTTMGEAPCAYAFVVFGSLAREEQLVGSDQDNGLIIADEASEADLAYFEEFGSRVCDILNDCGFVHCKGGIMAKNAEQRLTLSQWQERYTHWITRPTEDRILRATIFFDMRHICGDASLSQRLHDDMLDSFTQNPLFISFLARDALRSKVPLGVFRNLVLDKGDDGKKMFNAKAQAIMPIVDIARTQALAAGIAQTGTIERLRALAAGGHMNAGDAQSLEDAMILVNEMRIDHQARQVKAGRPTDNLIAASDLSPLERDYLKDAFAVVRQALDGLRRNFAGGIA